MSERWVPLSLPYRSFPSPDRVSEPMSRMFRAADALAGGRSFSYLRSSSAAVVSVVMLPSSLR